MARDVAAKWKDFVGACGVLGVAMECGEFSVLFIITRVLLS